MRIVGNGAPTDVAIDHSSSGQYILERKLCGRSFSFSNSPVARLSFRPRVAGTQDAAERSVVTAHWDVSSNIALRKLHTQRESTNSRCIISAIRFSNLGRRRKKKLRALLSSSYITIFFFLLCMCDLCVETEDLTGTPFLILST